MSNQEEGYRYLDDAYWIGRWEGNNSPWQVVYVNPLLIKYISLLDGGKKDLKIFVPLCGKTVDMKWSGEGSFDAVWDRGSFGAINSGERTRYVDLLTRLKTQNAAHLLVLCEYDDRLYKEFPFSIPMSKVFEYWGEKHSVTLIDADEVTGFLQRLQLDFKTCKRSLYLVTLK